MQTNSEKTDPQMMTDEYRWNSNTNNNQTQAEFRQNKQQITISKQTKMRSKLLILFRGI